MSAYEYTVRQVQYASPIEAGIFLNGLGLDGWKLVAVDGERFYLMREIDTTSAIDLLEAERRRGRP